MLANNSSLVRYNNPVLVSTTKGKGKDKKGNKKLPAVDVGGKELTQTEDILNSILPPK